MSDARIDYIELPSATAHELTRAFYSKAFGWTFTDYGPEYAATTNGVTDVGLQGDRSEALSAPLPVIRVDLRSFQQELATRLAAKTAAQVESSRLGLASGDQRWLIRLSDAGGVIAKSIFEFPGGRRFHFIDPSGSELAAWSAT